ncbi:MAG: SufS family cysteine desulfurase [Treponema sp.]
MYKHLFPLLNNRPVHYLDAAATAQRPAAVLDGVRSYYEQKNGNAGRGSHSLAVESSLLVEEARAATAQFIGANTAHCDTDTAGEIIFTKNATEALNIIAYCYGLEHVHAGDEILISIANHHANLVPWQYVAQKTGAALQYVYCDSEGNFDFDGFCAKLSNKTKIVAVSCTVNTTGVVNPAAEIIAKAHEYGAVAVIDAAQSITHFPHDVRAWDCDFLVFSGHKLYSQFGVGVLYAKSVLLEKMPPFLYGGSMIEFVTEEASTYQTGFQKYEGGTLDTAAIHSLKLSIDFIESIGWTAIHSYLFELDQYMHAALSQLDFVEMYQITAKNRVPITAFNVKNVHSHDTACILDEYEVMVRSGHHCTQPLMKHIGVPSCCRASLGLYNTPEDIDCLAAGLKKVYSIFKQ